MVSNFLRPTSLRDALALAASHPGAFFLGGGTFLHLSAPNTAITVIAVAGLLPRGVNAAAGGIEIGAGTTFSELAEDPGTPDFLREVALSMGDRNVRNRATVGGNLGANQPDSTLIPALLALDAEVVPASGTAGPVATDGTALKLADFIALEKRPLVLAVRIPAVQGRHAAFLKSAPTAVALPVCTAAVSFVPDARAGGTVRNLRIALGGVDRHVTRLPEAEARLEGTAAGAEGREAVETLVASLVTPFDDRKGSAAYKKSLAARLAADAFVRAAAQEKSL